MTVLRAQWHSADGVGPGSCILTQPAPVLSVQVQAPTRGSADLCQPVLHSRLTGWKSPHRCRQLPTP